MLKPPSQIRPLWPFVGFAVALGFEVSGIESRLAAVILWVIAGGLVLWWGYGQVSRRVGPGPHLTATPVVVGGIQAELQVGDGG